MQRINIDVMDDMLQEYEKSLTPIQKVIYFSSAEIDGVILTKGYIKENEMYEIIKNNVQKYLSGGDDGATNK